MCRLVPDGPTLTTEMVAMRLRVHVKTVQRWISKGELPAVNVGSEKLHRYRIYESDYLNFRDRRLA